MLLLLSLLESLSENCPLKPVKNSCVDDSPFLPVLAFLHHESVSIFFYINSISVYITSSFSLNLRRHDCIVFVYVFIVVRNFDPLPLHRIIPLPIFPLVRKRIVFVSY